MQSSNTALQKQHDDAGAIMERVLIVGDLAKLTPDERVTYYNAVCSSVGLNALTKPFSYIVLNGKLTLYANKDCTEQLRKNNKVSIYKIEKEQDGDLYIVTAYARTADGREDIDMGAVSTANAKGDNLVNARLKAVTKAKRRVTLSICGLGVLDETEVQTIPDARPVVVTEQGEIVKEQPAPLRALPSPQPIESQPEIIEYLSYREVGLYLDLAKRKGIDLDAALQKKGKPAIDKLPYEEAKIVHEWLKGKPDIEQPTAPQQATERDWRIEIDVMWRTLWNCKVRGFESKEACLNHLVTTALSFRWVDSASEVKSLADIATDQAEKYYSTLCDLYEASKQKDDPLM